MTHWCPLSRSRELLVQASFGFLLSVSITLSTEGQTVIEIGGSPSCQQCEIVTEHVTSLGSLDDPVSAHLVSAVRMDSQGRYVVAPTYSPYEILVYGPDGMFLRTIGRRGQGPREFTQVSRARVGAADSVHVLDIGMRHTVWTPGMKQFVAFSRLPFPTHDWLFLPDGGFVVSSNPSRASYQGRMRVGSKDPLLHVFSADGELLRSFDNSNDIPGVRSRDDMLRNLGRANGNRFWAARASQYRLDLWSATGQRELSIIRHADFYPSRVGEIRVLDGGHPNQVKPPATTYALWEDEAERLWVMINVADRNWKPMGRKGGFAIDPDSMAAQGISFDALYDTIVEVLDPQQRRVVARTRFDRLIRGYTGWKNRVYLSRWASDGNTEMDIVDLVITNRR